MDAETLELDGTCRVTTATRDHHSQIAGCIPMDEDESDALYRQNTQVADLNALASSHQVEAAIRLLRRSV